MEQLRVRELIRPPGGDNITYEQAKQAWLEVMREDREADERRNVRRLARQGARKAREQTP